MNVGELPTPSPGSGEILLRVLRIGLRMEKGAVAAHGICGEVIRVGGGVVDVLPGERYAVQSVVGCGECDYCFRSRENLCPKAYHTQGFGQSGSFAELVVVPQPAMAQGCLIPLPEGVDADFGLFVEPLAFCICGLNHIPIANNYHLVVIGAGITGILSGLTGRYRNARKVTVIDSDRKRMEILRSRNLPFEVLEGGDDAVSRVLAEAPGGVEAVVCTIPDMASIRRAFSLSAIGGHISLMVPVEAAPGGPSLDPAAITRRELHVHGASGASRIDYIEARHMIAEGIIPARELISHRFAIGDLRSAIVVLADQQARPLLVSLEGASEPVPAERRPEAALPAGAPVESAAGQMAPVFEEEEEGPQSEGFVYSDAEIAEMARRVREPVFDYGPGSQLGPSGELTPWPDLPADYLRERELERQRRSHRERGGRRHGGRERDRSRSRRQSGLHPPPASAQPERQEAGRRGRRRRGRGRGQREREGQPVPPQARGETLPPAMEAPPLEKRSREEPVAAGFHRQEEPRFPEARPAESPHLEPPPPEFHRRDEPTPELAPAAPAARAPKEAEAPAPEAVGAGAEPGRPARDSGPPSPKADGPATGPERRAQGRGRGTGQKAGARGKVAPRKPARAKAPPAAKPRKGREPPAGEPAQRRPRATNPRRPGEPTNPRRPAAAARPRKEAPPSRKDAPASRNAPGGGTETASRKSPPEEKDILESWPDFWGEEEKGKK